MFVSERGSEAERGKKKKRIRKCVERDRKRQTEGEIVKGEDKKVCLSVCVIERERG